MGVWGPIRGPFCGAGAAAQADPTPRSGDRFFAGGSSDLWRSARVKEVGLLDNGHGCLAIFEVMGILRQQAAISRLVAILSPTFGAESVVFVRLSAPSLEGSLIFPKESKRFCRPRPYHLATPPNERSALYRAGILPATTLVANSLKRCGDSSHQAIHCASPRNNGNRAYQYYLDGLNVKGKRIPLKKRPIYPNKKVSRNRSPEVTFPNQGEPPAGGEALLSSCLRS